MEIKKPQYDEFVKCPICECDNVHPVGFMMNMGGQVISIFDGKVSLTYEEPIGRGTIFNIFYWCENECSWSENYHFHKGTLYKNISESPVIEGTLWRD